MNDERKESGSKINISPRLILGVSILLVGVLFTLDNLDVFDAGYVFEYWPLVFVAIGAVKLRDANRTGAWLSGGVWMVVGATWILYNIDIIDVHPIELWPVLLIIAGFALVRRAIKPPRKKREDSEDGTKLSGVACLSGVSRQTSSKDFRGGDFTAVMGGCEVDLRNAEIGSGEAVLDVFALMGGVDIRVPETFTVDAQVTAILGGFEDKTDQRDADPNQRLVIRGIAMMGGVDVRN